MEQKTSLTEIIEYIDPGTLNYQEWVNVGMALKQEGYSVNVWDTWSRRDIGRYHQGECARKWNLYWSSFLVTLCSEIMLYIETPLVSYSYSLNEVSHSCTS